MTVGKIEPSWKEEGSAQKTLRDCVPELPIKSAQGIVSEIVYLNNALISKDCIDRVESRNEKPPAETEGLSKLRDVPPESTIDQNNHIVPQGRIFRKQEMSMSEEGFLKLNRTEYAKWLMAKHPWAYLLLNLIAIRACRILNDPSGLNIGEARIGDHKSIGATRGQYRHAVKVLEKERAIEIIETCRNLKKTTNGTTTLGTKVKLIDSRVWDINPETYDHPNDHPTTTQRPPNDHVQEDKNDKNDKKDHHPSPSSKVDDDDFFQKNNKKEFFPGVWMTQQEMDDCVQKRGSFEMVETVISQIKSWDGRESEIKNWHRTITTWKLKNNRSSRIHENEKFAKIIDDKYSSGSGWTARIYHDKNKDQRGILFEGKGAYCDPVFFPMGTSDFELQVNSMIKQKRMDERL